MVFYKVGALSETLVNGAVAVAFGLLVIGALLQLTQSRTLLGVPPGALMRVALGLLALAGILLLGEVRDATLQSRDHLWEVYQIMGAK